MFFSKPPITTLRVFMKSGNSFDIDGILNWEVGYNHETCAVNKFTINRDPTRSKTKLIMASLVLEQIEAILELS